MKRIVIRLLSMAAIAVLALSCKNSGAGNSGDTAAAGDSTANQTAAGTVSKAASTASDTAGQKIDTLALFDRINGMLTDLSGESLWSKDLFTSDYYEACQKLDEFSDGDALWGLGSIQEVTAVGLTDPSEFKIHDYAHITAEAILSCKDITDNSMTGSEFRTLSLILRDGRWLIDDVNFSKEEIKKAVESMLGKAAQ